MKSPQIISLDISDESQLNAFEKQVKNKSDALANYFLAGYFLAGLLLAFFYDTWSIALGVGSLSLFAYYTVRYFLPQSHLYQYVLGAVLGIFMAQYIFQMHGLFEMHFTAFIGSALLVTYHNWKLQIPLLAVVIVHHALFGYLQFAGVWQANFTQPEYLDLQTFIIHILLSGTIFFLCGLGAYRFNKYSLKHIELSFQSGRLQEEQQQKKALVMMSDQLKASNLRLNEAEKIARIGSWERNFSNNMLIWSDEMYRIFDIERTGFNINYDAYLSFIHSDDRNYVNEIDRKCQIDKQPFSYECRIITMKGTLKTIYVSGRVALNNENKIIKTYGVVQDITCNKIIEESVQKSEAALRTVFDNTDTAYFLIDSDLKVVFFNQKAEKFVHQEMNNEISTGKLLTELFPLQEQLFIKDTLKSVLKGATTNYNINYLQPDRSDRWYNAKYLPVTDNDSKISGVILSLTPFTERTQVEKKSVRGEKYILTELEDKSDMVKSHEELLHKNSQLLKTNEKLESIIYSATHDLRTPLTSVLGLVDFIENETKEPGTRKHAGMIKGRIKLLDDFTANLIKYLCNIRSNVSVEKISFHQAVWQSVNNFRNTLGAGKIDFQIQVNETHEFYSDAHRIKTIIDNLVDNAIKFYNHEQDNPFIHIAVNANEKEAEIIIEDNGMGISNEHQEKIFEMFYRIEGLKNSSSLGLYLVKEIVEKLNGTVSLQSYPGKGSKFTITLINKRNGKVNGAKLVAGNDN